MNAVVPFNAQANFTVGDVEKVAHAIAKGGLFGSKDPYAVLTLCLLAQAEGQHPAVVFRDYHIISGKPAKKAEAMLRDFINAGGKIEWHELTDAVADATFSHPSGGSARISWDHKRAVQAQLAGNAMYKKYPRQMLRSRTISEGVRTIYPGATSGLYVPEEVSSFGPSTAAEEVQNGGLETAALPPQTIEHAPQPAKVPGIQKIKNAIREMKELGNSSTDLESFTSTVAAYRNEMAALEEAQHSWWTGQDGEGNSFEGIPAWIERRRKELSEPEDGMFKMLIDSMKECATTQAMSNWRAANESVIEALDDADGRNFQLAWDLHESAILLEGTARS